MNARLARIEIAEMVEQQHFVVAQVAQRRHVQREHRKPVIEVGAETAAADFLAHVAVGRGDDARVRDAALGFAHALEFAVFEHAQQLCLQLERQLADLVEKERGVLGVLEIARARGRGAR